MFHGLKGSPDIVDQHHIDVRILQPPVHANHRQSLFHHLFQLKIILMRRSSDQSVNSLRLKNLQIQPLLLIILAEIAHDQRVIVPVGNLLNAFQHLHIKGILDVGDQHPQQIS